MQAGASVFGQERLAQGDEGRRRGGDGDANLKQRPLLLTIHLTSNILFDCILPFTDHTMTRIDAWDIQSPSAIQALSCDLPHVQNLEERYQPAGKELGKGGFGSVFLVKNEAGEEFACKRINKCLVGGNPQSQARHLSNIKREIAVMKKLGGTLNTIHLFDSFEDDDSAYLIMEHCSGGELFQNLGARHYSEGTCKSYMRAVLRTIAQCHNLNIIHRDVKPSNFLLLTPDEDSPIKAIDFGLAIFFEPSDLPISNLGLEGTPWFMAPELLNCKAGPTIDVFAAGVMCYQLLTGTMPFNDWKNTKNPALSQVWKSILADEPKVTGSVWADISDQAKDFVKSLLVKDPSKRPTAKEALQHPWLKEGKKTQRKEGKQLGRSVVQRLQRYAVGNAFKKTVLELMTNELIARHRERMSSEAKRQDPTSLAAKVDRVMKPTSSLSALSHLSVDGSISGRATAAASNERRLVARDLLLSKSVHGGTAFHSHGGTAFHSAKPTSPWEIKNAQPSDPLRDLRSLAEKVQAISSISPHSSSDGRPGKSYPSLSSPGKDSESNLLSYSLILGATQGVKQAASSIGHDLQTHHQGTMGRINSRDRVAPRVSSMLSMLDFVDQRKNDHSKVRRLMLDTSARGRTSALSTLMESGGESLAVDQPSSSPRHLLNPSLRFQNEKAEGPGSSQQGGGTPQGMLDALEFLLPEATVHELKDILAHDSSMENLSFERVSAALSVLGYNLGPGEVELLLREISGSNGPSDPHQMGAETSREVSRTQFIASQVDWKEIQANHRDEWLVSLRKTFDEMDQDKDGVLDKEELASLLASRLPSEEAVNEAVNELLLDVACSDGVNFSEFLQMMREDSHHSLGSSLDLYDARHEGSRHDGSLHGVRLEAIESDDEEDGQDQEEQGEREEGVR